MSSSGSPRWRPVLLGGRAGISSETLADGSLVMRSREALGAYPERLTDCLASGAARHPQRTLVGQRRADGTWRELSYAQMLEAARSIAAALGERGLSAERPLMILSGNDIEHLQLTLGALWAGVPVAPVSPAYSLVSQDFARLRHLIGLVTPGVVFAASARGFGRALETCVPEDCEIVIGSADEAGVSTATSTPATRLTRAFTPLASLLAHDGSGADALHARVRADSIAKFLFTSGSTKLPKAVPNTHRMLCSNQQMILQAFPVLGESPPVLVDWLPWNHTFGGNHNLGLVLYNGGTLYVDEGKPVAHLFNQTLENLRAIAPTIYFNVPKGWEDLAFALQADDALARHFFSRLKFMFFAGAGLSQDVWDRIDRVAEQHCGERVRMLTGIGMTESSPGALFTTGADIKSGDVGLPIPGCEAKLTPVDGKLELRLRGPNVMPGYWRAPHAQAEAFDDQGFYRTGDALVQIDPERLAAGLRFDGRLAEDFKLSSGTFVSVGPLRARIIAEGAPYIQDVVLAGLNRPYVAALVFVRGDLCARLAATPPGAPLAQILACDALRDFFRDVLVRLEAAATGTSTRVGALVLLEEPPSLDAAEITDKGSINQRAVLTRRAALVEDIFQERCAAALRPGAHAVHPKEAKLKEHS
jgi:feruloyl-CoA synthase